MRALLPVLVLFLSGCSILPSGWNPFGTPLSRVETATAKQEQAQSKVLGAVQEEVHKASHAVQIAKDQNEHGLPVAQQHLQAAKTLLDQVLGPPVLATEQRWRELIDRQTSQDAEVRKLADKESQKRLDQIGKLSQDLQNRDSALEVANQRAQEYAKELQGFKDVVLKIGWVIGAFFALYFLGQILQFAANFNPAFGTASNFVNAVVSPALHSAAYKARKATAAAVAAVKSNP